MENGSQNEENKLCSTCKMPMAKRRYVVFIKLDREKIMGPSKIEKGINPDQNISHSTQKVSLRLLVIFNSSENY
ncbi:hypothetical protein BpHYR1_027273 [Brachionus plicatilis]|uniref:Uncharacterized protein n=1 Tax=Brachionus plicatilis TaxID=10195 RepID=A0A3M7RBG0_BRAPC|nr:hypothetical protein BpHYR1_027273 [Brachionus plicatilis]